MQQTTMITAETVIYRVCLISHDILKQVLKAQQGITTIISGLMILYWKVLMAAIKGAQDPEAISTLQ